MSNIKGITAENPSPSLLRPQCPNHCATQLRPTLTPSWHC